MSKNSVETNKTMTFRILIAEPVGYKFSKTFEEVAIALTDGIKQCGFNCEWLYTNDFNTPTHIYPIILGAQLVYQRLFPKHAIIYNLEQITAGSQGAIAGYLELLKKHSVWDYSSRNISALKQLGIGHVQHVPIGWSAALEKINPAPVQDIDILFYGSINPRRSKILEALTQKGLNVKHLFTVFSTERDSYIARAKVVLNLHFYESHIFEIVRVSYLLANGIAVVSELNPNTEIEPSALREAMLGVPYDELVNTCVSLIQDEPARHLLSQRARQIFQQFPQCDYLRPVLERIKQGITTSTSNGLTITVIPAAIKTITTTDIATLLNQAISAHNQGNLSEAESLYRQTLTQEPSHFDALHMLGLVRKNLGFLDEGLAFYNQATTVRQDIPALWCNRGVTLFELAKYEEALASYDTAIALQANYPTAWNNKGNTLTELKQHEAALASYQQAIQLKPDYAEAYHYSGHQFKALGRFAEAEAAYRQAITLCPNDASLYSSLGVLLNEQMRLEEAESCYKTAITITPDNAELYIVMGTLLAHQKRLAEAETAYQKAIELRPNHAETHYNFGILMVEQKKYTAAETAYRQAIKLRPDMAEFHFNFAVLLNTLQRYLEAESEYKKTIALRTNYAEACLNLGNIVSRNGRFIEAEQAYQQAITARPDYADAQFNLGYLLLAQGRFKEGWPWCEARTAPDKTGRQSIPPDLPFPQWKGESLHGKSIVIWREQGLGDEIQFARYIPILKKMGATRITLACKAPLQSLFRNIPYVDNVIIAGDPVPIHDYWTFPLSIPLYVGTTLETIPIEIPYLQVPDDLVAHWKVRLPTKDNTLKVGLVWKGSATHANDAHRSLANLETLAPLWSIPNIQFISLQKGQGEDQAQSPPTNQPLLNLGTEMQNFADAAAIVKQLDLVICVDTAIAHLAGALGKPCWVMLSSVGTDWRWLHDRRDSPWYPSLQLFRQNQIGQWSETVKDITIALSNLVNDPPSTTLSSVGKNLMTATNTNKQVQLENPIVSIILPVYNAAPYLAECLDSLLNQDFKSFEVIAVNDGSTDGSGLVLNDYAIKDQRIKVHHFAQNAGETKAVQHAWQQVTGQYTARMDNDDICLPNRLSKQVDFLNNNPTITVVGSNMEMFGTHNGLTDLPLIDRLIKANFIIARANICNPTAMWRTAWFAEHGVSYGNLKNVSDYGMWVDCMLAGGNFANIKQSLVKYRMHPVQASKDTQATNTGVQSIMVKLVSHWYPQLSLEQVEALASICHGVGSQSLTMQIIQDAFTAAELVLNDNNSRFNEDRVIVARHIEQRVQVWKNAIKPIENKV